MSTVPNSSNPGQANVAVEAQSGPVPIGDPCAPWDAPQALSHHLAYVLQKSIESTIESVNVINVVIMRMFIC